MSLRTRLAVLAALAVAMAVLVISAVAYRASRDQQLASLDSALIDRAEETAVRASVLIDFDNQLQARASVFVPEGALQIIDDRGEAVRPEGQAELPVTEADRAVAAGDALSLVRDITIDGERSRVVTVPIPEEGFGPRFGPRGPGGQATSVLAPARALQLAESRAALDDSLAGLRRSLILVALLGVISAALMGMVVARRALRPVGRLTEAAEHVAATQDLDASIAVDRPDELGRLATAFNAMLAALGRSREQQQQLVTDASHELRTPLTSLRTNVELLQRAQNLPADERREIVDAAVDELEELSAMVAELVDLATDNRVMPDLATEMSLVEVADGVVARWQRRREGTVTVTGVDSAVMGHPELIERALSNLVDNAAKWSSDDAPIDIAVSPARVAVRDRGPGIDPAERSRIFDRFYRSPGSQDRPGSGLGLAIVKQIAETHGGEVFVEDPPDGPGAIVGFTFDT